MIKIFYFLIIVFVIHGIFNFFKNKLSFYNWYESFILIMLDKFIIEGIPSYSRLLIFLYFILVTLLSIRKVNLLKLD